MKTMQHIPHAQRGAILIISLIILVILTALGVSVMQGSVIEQRLATHQRDMATAMQAAEMALRSAETALKDGQNPILWDDFENQQNIAGLYAETPVGGIEPWRQKSTWSGNGSVVVNGNPAIHAQPPRYIIERVAEMAVGPSMDQPQRIRMLRITAIGYGSSAQSRVLLQSYYRWN